METNRTSTRTQFVRRASEIVPIQQTNSNWNEKHRRLHDETRHFDKEGMHGYEPYPPI